MSTPPASHILQDKPKFTGLSQQLNDKITSYFSPDQIALAVTIHKSKLERLSTAEYCEQLKKHIKIGKPPVSTEKLRYIDTVDFWKDQYTKIHIQKQELEDKLNCVEQFRFLTQKDDQNDDNRLITSFEQYTRKLLSSVSMRDNSDNFRSPKRQALTRSREQPINREMNQEEEKLLGELKLINLCSNALRIRRKRVLLEKALVNTTNSTIRNLAQIETLAKHTCQILEIIEATLWNSCQPYRLLKTRKAHIIQIFQHMMDQIVRAFLACFDALNELCNSNEISDQSYQSEITYRMVSFFQKSLELIHTSSCFQANHETTSKYQGGTCDERSGTTEDDEYVVNKSVARCLTFILQSLDWSESKSNRSDFCEGILFLILDYTGRLISEAVFSEHVAACNSPGNITNDYTYTSTCMNQLVIRLESKYMLQVLQAALNDENKKRVVADILSSYDKDHDDRHTLTQLPSMSYKDLHPRAAFLLQSTLVKSAVGGDDMESLRMPTPPADGISEFGSDEEEEDKYGSEWLLEKVWTIIGWDLVT